MAPEESPSLDLYKEGMPSDLPDPSRNRRRVWAVIIGLAVLGIGLALLNMAQDGTLAVLTGTGNVTGMVYDDQGNPIVADVFVLGASVSAQSDQTGHFRLEGIPTGQRIIIVAYQGIGREYPVSIIAGQTANIGEARFQADDFPSGWSQ